MMMMVVVVVHVEGNSSKYTEYVLADSRQGVVLQLGLGRKGKQSFAVKLSGYENYIVVQSGLL
jgi:hypothetical protein